MWQVHSHIFGWMKRKNVCAVICYYSWFIFPHLFWAAEPLYMSWILERNNIHLEKGNSEKNGGNMSSYSYSFTLFGRSPTQNAASWNEKKKSNLSWGHLNILRGRIRFRGHPLLASIQQTATFLCRVCSTQIRASVAVCELREVSHLGMGFNQDGAAWSPIRACPHTEGITGKSSAPTPTQTAEQGLY